MPSNPVPRDSTVELHLDELRLALRPDLGGCVAGFWLAELPVLHSAEPATLQSARPSGCYPLVPFSNRVGYAHFRWHGHDQRLRVNVPDSQHAMHGVGWQRPWQVLAQDARSARIGLTHTADEDWPFAFEAEQQFELQPGALTMRLTVRNTDARPAPVGLGWHPYLTKRTRSRLHLEVAQRWDSDPATQLPTRRTAQPGIDGDVVHLAYDHCFEGWTGAARLRDERLSMRMSSSLSYVVVYTPQTKPYYCVEPVSHVSNAIQMADPLAHGLLELAPGAQAEAWMRIEVARA